MFFEKNYSSSQSKNDSEFYKFQRANNLFQKNSGTPANIDCSFHNADQNFCPKSENFPPVVQKFIKVFGIRKKFVFSSKETFGLEKHSFDNSVENFPQNVWTFLSMSKNGNAKCFQERGFSSRFSSWQVESSFDKLPGKILAKKPMFL